MMQHQHQHQQQQQQPPPQYHQKGTPARRRQNRHSTNSPMNRNYASESDMTDVPFPMDFHGTPHTPQKSASNSPAPNSQGGGHHKSKPRNNNNNNKQRPKNVSTSPKPIRQGRHTPPHSTVPKSATAAAFAGSTFHASPAPSSLPIPSFLAKPLDSPSSKENPGRVSQEPSPPPTDSEAPTPQRLPSASAVAREESPLDFFFRADRAEKEKAKRASSANTLASVSMAPGPFSPPSQPLSPRELRPVPNGIATDPGRRPAILRNPSSGISTRELDGTPGKAMGPAFSTPYQDRIRAARSIEKPQPGPSQQSAGPMDRTDALKKFLAIGSPSPSTRHAAPSGLARSAVFSSSSQAGAPAVSQVQQISVSSTTTTARVENGRPQDLLHMENSLRQILKLDSALNLGPAPAAANYRSS